MGALAVDLDDLAAAMTGRLVRREEADFDELRACFNGMIDRRPFAIARVTDEADVIAALAFVREHGLPLAVRSGGHSAPGHGVCDDGLVIDVRELRGVSVDPEARTASCGSGVDWGELDAATQAHGLAVTGGRVSTTGVCGLAIGSGSGWLERLMGLTSDNLIGLRLVTADGRVVNATETENPELLWASRGGGGNFGVITEMTFRLIPVGPVVLGGPRFYPIERAVETMQAYRELNRTAPPELCTGYQLQCAPPAPFIPAEMQGKPAVGVFAFWAGDRKDAEAGLALLDDALGEPVADLTAEIPYVNLQNMADANYPYGKRDYFKGGFIGDLSDDAIEAMVRYGNDLRAPLTNIILLPLGEHTAYADFGDEHSPLGFRDAQWSFQVLSIWEDPAEDEMHREWTREVAKVMSTYSDMVSFPNFISVDEIAKAKEAFSPGGMERLREVKRAWDPDNVFHRTVVTLA
jgi:FAD/FMN-containing dehydrogenase